MDSATTSSLGRCLATHALQRRYALAEAPQNDPQPRMRGQCFIVLTTKAAILMTSDPRTDFLDFLETSVNGNRLYKGLCDSCHRVYEPTRATHAERLQLSLITTDMQWSKNPIFPWVLFLTLPTALVM